MVSALFKSSEAGDVDQVREVLKECSSIDIETKDHTGTTPLIAAVKNSHIEVVKELLAAGADPLNPSSHGPPSSHTSDPELLSLLSMAVRPPPLHQQQQQQQYPSFNPHHQPPPQFQEMGYPPMEMQQGGGYPGFYPPAGMYIPQYGMPYPPPNGQFPQGMAPPQHHQQQMHMHMQQPQHEMQQQQMPPQQQQILPGEEKVGGENGVVGENGAGTIPPPDVSKMIPCKFFPDCRYGAQCAFLHPPQPAFTPPPAPPPSAMYPQHYQHGPEHFPHPFYQMPPPFGYNGQMRPPPPHVMSPPPQQQQQAPYPFQRHQHQPPHHLSMPDYNNENAFIVVPPPFQPPPNFSPSALATPFAPSPPVGLPTPQQQSSSSSSPPPPPPSAPVQEVSPPSDPAIVAVAVAPSATEAVPTPAVVEPVVQQQERQFTPQQQHLNNGFVRRTGPFGPGAGGFAKKNWLAGGAKKWLGGAVPPCIYFQRALCRNGDVCRFPHIRADGTDCRLPGVIDGSVPAAPVSNMNKPIANRNFPNNVDATPSTQQTLDSSVESLPASDAAPQDSPVEDKLANLSVASLDASASSSSSTTPTGPRSFSSHIPSAATPAFVPAPRSAGPPSHQPPFHNNNNVNRPMFPHQQPRSAPPTRPVSPNAISASQHFSQVASANQRSSSAAPLRRKEDGAPLGAPQQQQQMSQSSHVVKQRVPNSEDFPALGGGSVGSLRESVGSLGASVVVVGKTAAQVLSGPAPEKAKVALGGKKMAAQQKKKVEEDARSTESSSSSAEAPHHSDLSSEDDTVLVAAAKSAPSAPNGAPSPSLVKKPLSFANAAGALVGAKA